MSAEPDGAAPDGPAPEDPGSTGTGPESTTPSADTPRERAEAQPNPEGMEVAADQREQERDELGRPEPAEGPPVADDRDGETASVLAREARTRTIEDMFAVRSGRDTFVAAGTQNVHQYFGVDRATSPASMRLDEAMLTAVTAVHVSSDSDARLLDQLRGASRLALLRGRRDSGRMHSAIAALAALVGTPAPSAATDRPSRVTVLSSTTSLDHLATGVSYQKDRGYAVDATGAPWVRTGDPAQIGALREKVRNTGAWLVVVTDERAPSPAWADVLVEHEHDPKRCEAILRRHLTQQYPGDVDQLMAAATTYEDVDAAVRDLREPWDAAGLAEAIATWAREWDEQRPAPPKPQEFRQQHVRQRARELLQVADPAEAPRAQAFVLSGAVLDGEGLGDVILAAHRLCARLTAAQDADNPPPKVVFGDPLPRWLHHVQIADDDAPAPDDLVLTSTRRSVPKQRSRSVVRLYEPTIVGPLVDVVWNEYDEARLPFLAWLMDLCSWANDTVRIRAAVAIGRIATMDFETVERLVLTPWAASNDVAAHRAVAWALEGVVVEGSAAAKALGLLRRWSRARSRTARAVAVRAYGTRIGALHPREAIEGITSAYQSWALESPVVWAMVEIFVAGAHHEVLKELERWTKASSRSQSRSRYPVTAAICLVNLANLKGEPQAVRRPGRRRERAQRPVADALPVLLERVAGSPELERIVTDLWASALTYRATQNLGWNLLRIWRSIGEQRPEAAAIVRRVEQELHRDPELRRRRHFYENLWRS